MATVVGVIHPSLCLSGRDLVEPTPSPDGAWVLIGVRSGGRATAVVVSSAGGLERGLALDPGPALARGLGGGCWAWRTDSTGFHYAGVDGQLWFHGLDGRRCRLSSLPEGHEVSSPVVSPDGTKVAYVVDLAEVRVVAVDGTGDHCVSEGWDFVNDPTWSPTGDLVWQAWKVPNMAWDESVLVSSASGVLTVGAQVAVQQPTVDADGSLWSVDDASGWLNLRRDGVAVLAEPYEHAGPTWGPGQRTYAVSPERTQVVLHRNESGFGRLVLVDVATGTARELARGIHAQLRWVGGTVTALRTGARTPTQVVAYDTTTWERRVLAVGPVAEWDEVDLVEPELVSVDGADGTIIPARCYRPRTGAGGPLLVWIHGGPTDQWSVTFLARVAYWVAAGATVVVVDHRGSTGHGRAFQQALRGRWGYDDVTDVASVIAHAHRLGWGHRSTTVLLGGSAGGYCALGVVSAHPELVAGAAVVYPVTDPAVLADATYRFEAHYTDTLCPVPPVAVAPEAMVRPVLILHGDADPVVPVSASAEFVRRARAVGAPVELVVYPGEGHGFRQPTTQLDEFTRLAAFISAVTTDR